MPPPRKKTRLSAQKPVSEILFDPSARQDYLTGFHKRKLARVEQAKEQAVKRAREEKIEERRQLRDQRKADLAKHYHDVNVEYRKMNPDLSSDDGDDDDNGPEAEAVSSQPIEAVVPDDEEYVDEDKYTTVTVEAMEASDEQESGHDPPKGQAGDASSTKNAIPKSKPKVKKKKFRYETKSERKETRMKQKAKNKRAAQARKEK